MPLNWLNRIFKCICSRNDKNRSYYSVIICDLLKADIFEFTINQGLAIEGWGWLTNFSVSGGHSKNRTMLKKTWKRIFLLSITVCHFLRFEYCISVGGATHFNPLVWSLFIQPPKGRWDNSDKKNKAEYSEQTEVRCDSFFFDKSGNRTLSEFYWFYCGFVIQRPYYELN